MGIQLFGLLLYLTHFLACVIVGFLFRFWKNNDKENVVYKNTFNTSNKYITFSNLGEILASSIMNAIHTIVMIGGFVIIFSVIISILNSSGVLTMLSNILSPFFKNSGLNVEYIKPIISGLVELTNGLSNIVRVNTKSISITITLTAFLLGFGGLSVLLQVLSITSKSDISIKPYIIGKFLHGIIAAILTYIFIHIFPIFNLDISPVFSQNVSNLSAISTEIYKYSWIILIIIFTIAIFLFTNTKKRKTYISKNYH